MQGLIQLGLFATLLLLGYFFGRRSELRHYRDIRERESALGDIVITTDRLPPNEFLHHETRLVNGNVVISIDYFKLVAAGLRNLIGGRLRAFESLLDRARREALLRMQAEARDLGAEATINTKFETSRISGNASRGIGSMEVLAYGTAMITPKKPT